MKHTFLSAAMKRPNTDGEEPRLLHEFFERQVKLRPDHPAVECNGEVLTYSELDAAANRVAMSLRSCGVRGGSLVALYLEKSCGLFAALLGTLKVGAGYVPIDPKSPVARIESILQDANVAAVISEGDLAKRLEFLASPEVLILGKALARKARSAPRRKPVIIAPSDSCYVIYTSGSTGRPKGVIIEHQNAVNFVRALRTVYKLSQDDRVYQGFSIAFDASVEEIWGAFSVGGTLVVPSAEIARSTFDAAEFIESRKITFFSTVPSFLATMKTELKTVRLLVLGGEVCPPELVNRFVVSGRRMLNTYGPTEATVVATAAECVPGEPVTIGTALPGYMTYVLDEQMRAVKPGESGELYIGGDSIARGYMNQPELTAERFLLNPFAEQGAEPSRIYRTLDLVRLTESGCLQFLGRADGQIKIRGFRIELSEIEAVLMEHPFVRAAAVNVVEFGTLKELAAYVVVETEADELSHVSVAELLRSRLPEYMVPRYLDVLDELPAMISGKVDRKQLPLPRTLLGGRAREIVPPATDLERAIVEIWEQQFQLTPISVEDDFFLDLRGHSLIASHVVTELRSRLQTLHVSITDLYEHRTARLLATHLKSIGVDTESKAAHDETPVIDSTVAEKAPLSRFRLACAALQVVGVLAYYGVVSAPLVFAVVLVLKVLNGERDLIGAIDIATTIGFLVWPSWLLLSIVLKWTVIGRYKAGRYPVWGFYYFRWWLVSRFQALSWSEMFVGTPLMSLYYRAMGAKVGKYCSIGTPLCTAFDLVTIGDNTSIGSDTQILGYRIEDGWLIVGNVTIGSECFIGTHCCIGLGTTMRDRSRLDDMSHLADGSIVDPGLAVRGSPAQISDVHLQGKSERRFGRSVLFGLLHLGLIYAMGYILILSFLPGLAVVAYALYVGGPLWGIAAALAATPISMIWYLLLVVAVKWIAIGQILPGVYPLHSREYLRYWFLNFLLNNTRHIALALYATLFLPKFLKMLGAKIGRGVEISTAMHIMPDLLEIDDGSFLADACIVGGHRIHDGVIEIRRNRIGKRTFIGNSALVPVGIDVGDNSLIGVMSTPPMGVRRTANGTRWLGSPGFELPHTQTFGCFTDRQTYSPGYDLVLLRSAIEVLRVFLPGLIAIASLVTFCAAITLAYSAVPLWAVALLTPCIAAALSVVAITLVAVLKKLMMGEFKPTVQPLWCSYVWLNEVVNGLYETVAAAAMAPLLGTPFIATCLRMMGCKIGRWVFLETTLFSEFDLVEIGDRAALNLGATIQTHLFEDRIMKADHIKIGEGCSVGNMAVILYGTEMKLGASLCAFSVLMKGEVLPAFSRWAGIPTQLVESTSIVPEGPIGTTRMINKPSQRLQSANAAARRRHHGVDALLLGSSSGLVIQHQLSLQPALMPVKPGAGRMKTA